MKDRLFRFILVILFTALLMSIAMKVSAKPRTVKNIEEPFVMLTTGYCDSGLTCTGVKTREGICAVRKEWVGKTAIVYEYKDGKIGEILGYWECLDTGFGADSDGDGIGSIQEGYVIDMYFQTESEVYDWMRKTNGRVYVQLIDGVG